MKPIRCLANGAVIFATPRFSDSRGTFAVPYLDSAAASYGLPDRFVQDNHSISNVAGTIRGLHLQLPPWSQAKLVRVLRGSVVDVIVDLRPGSPTHGHHEIVQLDAEHDQQLFIPAGFAHGFCTLEPGTEVFYKVDAPYKPEAEWTLAWDDQTLAIDWPIDPDQVVLSDKDAAGQTLAETTKAIEGAAS